LQAGSTASKLPETLYIHNVGLDTGFKARGSTAACNKSNSAKAVLA